MRRTPDLLQSDQSRSSSALLIRETAAAQVDWERIAAGYAALIQACIERTPGDHGR